MKLIQKTSVFAALALIGFTGVNVAGADEHDNHAYVKHEEWKKGAKIRQEDWGRGEHVDYKEHHLRVPPKGYEWREVDGNFVLAAAATGVIASVIAESR